MQNLVPDYWQMDNYTPELLVYLGKHTINELIHIAENGKPSTKHVDKLISLLKNKNAVAFQKEAAKFENPTFPNIGIQEGGWGDLEPLDADSINRERGATNFNVCGWCEYTSGGLGRYGYNITARCQFESEAGTETVERNFNTPCFLLNASDETFNNIHNGLLQHKKNIKTQIEENKHIVAALHQFKEKTTDKPILPFARPSNWFNVGDKVICYIDQFETKIINDTFATGKVVNGYRHHDGFVSVCFDKKIHTSNNLNGRGGGYYYGRPEVMLEWEFNYLKENHDFAKIWSTLGEAVQNFIPEQFLAHLTEHEINP